MNNIDATTKVRKIIAFRKRQLGILGEMLIVKHLIAKGFRHLDSNYRRKYGEIDLIFEYKGRLHFIEVKTVSREISLKPAKIGINRQFDVIHETFHKPEDNVSWAKRRRIARMIETYLADHCGHDREWQFDIARVYVNKRKRIAVIKFLKDITLDDLSFN